MNRNTTSSYAYVILVIMFLGSMSAPLHMFKVPPVMTPLMTHFGIGLESSGLLMSMFAVIGAVLALPSGLIMGRTGVKMAGFIAFAALIGGSILGAFASSFSIMLFSRMLEGVGMCFMAIVAPTAISAWFPPEKRSVAMGIWGTWVPVATILIYFVAPKIEASMGWQTVWWFCTIFTAVICVAYAVLFRMPQENTIQDTPKEELDMAAEIAQMKEVIAIPTLWMAAFVFLAYNYIAIALSSFMPSYLESLKFSTAEVTNYSTMFIIVNMFGVIAGGFVAKALKSNKKTMLFPFFLVIALLPFAFSGEGFSPFLWAIIFVCGVPIASCFSSAPEAVSKPEHAGIGMAVLAVGQNLGMFAGPFIFGLLAAKYNWNVAACSAIPVLVLGVLITLKMKIK